MICDAGKDGAEVGLGIDAVEPGGFDEGVDGGGPFASGNRDASPHTRRPRPDGYAGSTLPLRQGVLSVHRCAPSGHLYGTSRWR